MKKVVCFVLSVILAFCFCGTVLAQPLNLSAKAAILINAETGEVLFEKSGNMRLSMASTTKIMTSLILAEQKNLSKTITVTEQMVRVEGSSMGLTPGDKVSFEALLYGMLLASGNDAANTVAYALGGSINGFAKIMNNKAKQLGMHDTNFVTPSGLDDDAHYTTAYDMAVLTAVALKNKAFAMACSTKSQKVYLCDGEKQLTLTNHNKLLGTYEGLVGVKTGFTKKSGRCLVTAAERNGVRLVAVTLCAPNDWNDHKMLLDYGFEVTKLFEECAYSLPDSLPVVGGDCDRVRISSSEISYAVSEENASKFSYKVLLPDFLYSGVKAGQKIGCINYYYDNKLFKSTDIVCLADVYHSKAKMPFKKQFTEKFSLLLRLII